MKKQYRMPQFDALELDRKDVITASGETWGGEDYENPGGGGGSTGGDDSLNEDFWG